MLHSTAGRGTGLGLRFAVTIAAFGAVTGNAAAQDMPPILAPQVATPQRIVAASVTIPPAAIPVAAPAAPTPAAQSLPQAQLDQLLAPVALYPDTLLSQVLMASTYPLEVVEESRWLREPAHKPLARDALTDALREQRWDPSVMALAPFPRLLALMSDKLEWTEQLGNAFLAQQADVMSEVQRLRHEAMAAGNLKATPECHCVIRTSGATISILPSDNEVVCVPVYDPRGVYGTWREPDYPPAIFPAPPGFAFEPGIEIGFSAPIELAVFGPLWGWGRFDWGGGQIVVDNARYTALGPAHAAFAGGIWVHDPAHRGGVAYSNPAVAARFGAARAVALAAAGQAAVARGAGGRMAFGHPGAANGPGFRRQASPGVANGFGRHGAGFHGTGLHGGGMARGPGPVRGGGPIAHAQFSPGRHGGFGGGPHGGGAPHGGGGGHRH